MSLGSAPTGLTGNTGAGSAPLSLGSVVSGTYAASGNFGTAGQIKLYSILTITQPGVYVITYNLLASAQATTFNSFAVWVDDAFNGTSNTNYLAYQQIPYVASNTITTTIAVSSALIYNVTATTTFSLWANAQIATGNIATTGAQFQFKFVRIA